MRDRKPHTCCLHELSETAKDRAYQDELSRRHREPSPYVDDLVDDFTRVLRHIGVSNAEYDLAHREILGVLEYRPEGARAVRSRFPSWTKLHKALNDADDLSSAGVRPGQRLLDRLASIFGEEVSLEEEAWLDEGEILNALSQWTFTRTGIPHDEN